MNRGTAEELELRTGDRRGWTSRGLARGFGVVRHHKATVCDPASYLQWPIRNLLGWLSWSHAHTTHTNVTLHPVATATVGSC